MAPLSRFGLVCGLTAFFLFMPARALNIPKIYAQVLDAREAPNEVYDYVVIGAGTAGLTVGDRLSENGTNTVLVIEYGDFVDSAEVNNVRDRLQWKAEPSWVYNIISAPNKELHDKQSYVAAGSLVGGSSALNGMQCVRGTIDDYDRWGSFFGTQSTWSWNGMLLYFKKAIHFQPPSQAAVEQMPGLKYDQSFWGTTSRIFAGWPSFQWPGIRVQFDLFSRLPGIETPEDSGSGKPGVYWYPTFMDAEGSINRSYSRTGHWNGLSRDNYHLLTKSKVTNIQIKDKKATGVVYQASSAQGKDINSTTVKVNKEVILSAGTMHSPQILQLSGIGPRKLLESAGIATKIDLPGVGQNFHDHNVLYMNITFQNYTIRPNRRDDFQDSSFIRAADALWTSNRTGPWSRGIWNTGAWLPMPIVAPDHYSLIADKIDAQTRNPSAYLSPNTDPTVTAGYAARLSALALAVRSKNDVFYSHYFSGDAPVGYFTLEHVLSTGTININTTSPLDAEPVVDYRTYSNPLDFEIMLALARFHREINVLSPHLAVYQPLETAPGLNVTSDEDWVAYMRNNTDPTAQHPSGTCAMLPRELGGVVDEGLRVYGVEGLRVVDASVMSVIPGANLAGTVFALAEKAADMILGIHGQDV